MEKSLRKEKEFKARRSEILKEAEKIFASKGFYLTTMAEIANASGFAIGTLYQFFKGKEDLYTRMICEKLDKMYSEIRETVNNSPTIAEKIENLVSAHFYFVENNADFCNIFIRGEGATLSKGKTILRDKMISDYLNHITFIENIMRNGIEERLIKAVEPRVMACVLFGIVRVFIYDWMLTDQGTPLSSLVVCALKIFMNGVRAEVPQC